MSKSINCSNEDALRQKSVTAELGNPNEATSPEGVRHFQSDSPASAAPTFGKLVAAGKTRATFSRLLMLGPIRRDPRLPAYVEPLHGNMTGSFRLRISR